MRAADLHTHTKLDNVSTQRGMLRTAAQRGIDIVAVTNHDHLTPASALKVAKRIRDKLHLPLDLIVASETTVKPVHDDENRKGKHVLVFNQKKPLEPLMSWYDLAASAWRQGALVFAAHPEFGGISLRRNEIEIITEKGYPPDGIEIQNGAEALIAGSQPRIERFMASRLPERIKRWAHGQVPELGSNIKAQAIAKDFEDIIKGKSGGSDAHDKDHVGDVLVLFPENRELFDAMREGETLIVQLREPKPASAIKVGIEHVRGRKLDKPPKRTTAHQEQLETGEKLVA